MDKIYEYLLKNYLLELADLENGYDFNEARICELKRIIHVIYYLKYTENPEEEEDVLNGFVLKPLDVTKNGVYIPDNNTSGYSRVNVTVEPELETLNAVITENGTKTFTSKKDGFSSATITTSISVPKYLSDLESDSLHRTVSDSEKTY